MDINKMAFQATLHCLTGCAIGEVLGLILGTALQLDTVVTIALSIILAFIFGYSLSLYSVVKGGVSLVSAMKIVLAADTLSIVTMEIVDNLVMVGIPGAMQAGLTDMLFWFSMALSLVAAFFAAYPVNRYLLTKNKGHALLHEHHAHSHSE